MSSAWEVSLLFFLFLPIHSLKHAPLGSTFNLPSSLKTLVLKHQLTHMSVHPDLCSSQLTPDALSQALSATLVVANGDSVPLAQGKTRTQTAAHLPASPVGPMQTPATPHDPRPLLSSPRLSLLSRQLSAY